MLVAMRVWRGSGQLVTYFLEGPDEGTARLMRLRRPFACALVPRPVSSCDVAGRLELIMSELAPIPLTLTYNVSLLVFFACSVSTT